MPVLPRIWAAFLAVTGILLYPFVAFADFRLFIFSLAILTWVTFFLNGIFVSYICMLTWI